LRSQEQSDIFSEVGVTAGLASGREHMLSVTKKTLLAVLSLAAALWLCTRTAPAIEAWAPGAGEIDLNKLPRETQDEKFHHAVGLIVAGQADSGVNELRELLAEKPDAPWAEQARYMIAFGLLKARKYEKAFEESEKFRGLYPESGLKEEAFQLQLRAAALRTREDQDAGVALFNRLVANAPSRESAVYCQKEKADAIMEAGDFMAARLEYLTLIELGDTQWHAYGYYKIAECDFRLAQWLRLGTEHLQRARNEYEDFVRTFPEHKLAGEAKQDINRVKADVASQYRQIADYYLRIAKRPSAAVPYLHSIITEAPGTEQAAWAAERLQEVVATLPEGLKQQYKRLGFLGPEPAEPQEQPEP
jgi:outer membrane protein assembly factor BamD (BamD/ComL family)